ncbi:MAG: hypothetical protein HY372_03775 [Candidatus Andersenbacteria bacterium]|nr:hypothetical protein [Candidatus Andersenbacteria bacterium]
MIGWMVSAAGHALLDDVLPATAGRIHEDGHLGAVAKDLHRAGDDRVPADGVAAEAATTSGAISTIPGLDSERPMTPYAIFGQLWPA